MYEIYADGILWEDSDGVTAWDKREVSALAELVESLGYDVEVVKINDDSVLGVQATEALRTQREFLLAS